MIIILTNFKKQKYSKKVIITIALLSKKTPEFVISDIYNCYMPDHTSFLELLKTYVVIPYVNKFGNLNPVRLLISFVAENFV